MFVFNLGDSVQFNETTGVIKGLIRDSRRGRIVMIQDHSGNYHYVAEAAVKLLGE